jgi:hypothetical protein
MAKKPEEKQELAVTEPKDTSLAKLNAAEAEAMYGKMEKEDLIIPRLTVLQGLSPEVQDGLGKPGSLFITSINRELGKEVEIIPLMRNRSRIRWSPRAEGKGIKCRSNDAVTGAGTPGGTCKTCPESQWNGVTPPSCDLFENVFVVLRQDADWFPLSFSGSRTKMKPFQALNTLLLMEQMRGRPIFGKSYVIKVIDDKNGKGDRYFNYRISVANENKPLPDLEVEKARELFNMIRVSNVKIEQESETPAVAANEEL